MIFGSATVADANGSVPRGVDPDPADVERAAASIAAAARPAIIVGSDVYWDGRVARARPIRRDDACALLVQRLGPRVPAR